MCQCSEQNENVEDFVEAPMVKFQKLRLSPVNNAADRVEEASKNQQE